MLLPEAPAPPKNEPRRAKRNQDKRGIPGREGKSGPVLITTGAASFAGPDRRKGARYSVAPIEARATNRCDMSDEEMKHKCETKWPGSASLKLCELTTTPRQQTHNTMGAAGPHQHRDKRRREPNKYITQRQAKSAKNKHSHRRLVFDLLTSVKTLYCNGLSCVAAMSRATRCGTSKQYCRPFKSMNHSDSRA